MIYLDYNATTPCAPEVVEAMLPWFSEQFGNSGSRNHAFGWQADAAVKHARQEVADLLHADASEIIFTSGATESCNLALRGVFERYAAKGNHIITCLTEHHAVLDTCKALENKGAAVTYLSVDREGRVSLDDLKAAIRPATILIAVMYANNETGVIQPVSEIGQIARQNGILFFSDATQAVGKLPIDLDKQPIDLLAMSGHKIYGPKGIGILYKRRRNPRVSLQPQMTGGGQEDGWRSGTLNVPGIVGLGKACRLAKERLTEDNDRLALMRDTLEQAFLKEKNVFINSGNAPRLAHVSNVAIEGIKAGQLAAAMNHEMAFSLGSACTSEVPGKSHVLKAMGLPDKRIDGSFRISLGRRNQISEIAGIAGVFLKAAEKLRMAQ
ncbi:MAG TPA: cysteine desulfurase family protein [Edaphocola sp.]|nr:cysteine desulfurase family protein [Edaphocola sp.]